MWIVNVCDWSIAGDVHVKSKILGAMDTSTHAQVAVLLCACLTTTSHFTVVSVRGKLIGSLLVPVFFSLSSFTNLYFGEQNMSRDFRIVSIVTFIIAMTLLMECLVMIKYHSSVEHLEETSHFKDNETLEGSSCSYLPDACFVAQLMLFVGTCVPSLLSVLFGGGVVSFWCSVAFFVQTWYGVGCPLFVLYFQRDFWNTIYQLCFSRKHYI